MPSKELKITEEIGNITWWNGLILEHFIAFKNPKNKQSSFFSFIISWNSVSYKRSYQFQSSKIISNSKFVPVSSGGTYKTIFLSRISRPSYNCFTVKDSKNDYSFLSLDYSVAKCAISGILSKRIIKQCTYFNMQHTHWCCNKGRSHMCVKIRIYFLMRITQEGISQKD